MKLSPQSWKLPFSLRPPTIHESEDGMRNSNGLNLATIVFLSNMKLTDKVSGFRESA